MSLAERVQECWQSRWWLDQQYAYLYGDGLSRELLDEAVGRVSEIFTGEWASRTPFHPMYGVLIATGSFPLVNLLRLGDNLLQVAGTLRLPSVIKDLQIASHFESARLELEVAAHLRRAGFAVEFRPRLPTGKRADILVRVQEQQVYIEIKKFAESKVHESTGWLVQSVNSALAEMFDHTPGLESRKYVVQLELDVGNLFGSDPEKNVAVMGGITRKIRYEIVARLDGPFPLNFPIPSIGQIFVGGDARAGSSVGCPLPSAEAELKRMLPRFFRDAIYQLHPEFPGILVTQTGAMLDPTFTTMIVSELLTHPDVKARHVCAVLFFPVRCAITGWSLFEPFAVLNENAAVPFQALSVFPSFSELLSSRAQAGPHMGCRTPLSREQQV